MFSCSDSSEKRCLKSALYRSVSDFQWPIVYTPGSYRCFSVDWLIDWLETLLQFKLLFLVFTEYNLSVLGLEKLHPFDAGKWGKVYEKLESEFFSVRFGCLIDWLIDWWLIVRAIGWLSFSMPISRPFISFLLNSFQRMEWSVRKQWLPRTKPRKTIF